LVVVLPQSVARMTFSLSTSIKSLSRRGPAVQFLDSPAEIVDRTAAFEKFSEPAVLVACRQDGEKRGKKVDRVGRQKIEWARHLKKSQCRSRHLPPHDLPAETVDNRPLGLGWLGGAGRIQSKGVAKPIHVHATR
jgi:hypothetical protein